MYIWNAEVETLWSYHDKDDDGDNEDYVVTADTFDKAITKVRGFALAKSRKFYDDEEKKNHYPVSTEIIRLERGDWIDG